jgi:alkanesulfonate monooxygenase SsuD/methylene tetrahydromethanopterin reductase-like flavin-dependent oxidoreductase (luciferase family)
MALAVQYASECNTMGSVEECRARRVLLDNACRKAGRDPGTLALSVMGFAALGETPVAAVDRERRAFDCMPNSRALFGHASGKFVGSIDAVAAQLRSYAQAGVSRVYLNHFDRRDLRGIELMGSLARAVTPAG